MVFRSSRLGNCLGTATSLIEAEVAVGRELASAREIEEHARVSESEHASFLERAHVGE